MRASSGLVRSTEFSRQRSACTGPAGPPHALPLLEQTFDNERGGMNPTTPPTARHPRREAPRGILAHQLTPPLQRHGSPLAVPRARGHHRHEHPTTQVQRRLRHYRPPRGAPPTGTLHPLAMDITDGRPVKLPKPTAVPLLSASCCDTGPIVDNAQPWSAHPTRGWIWTPDVWDWRTPTTGSGCGHGTDCATNPKTSAGLTGPDEHRRRTGMTPSTTVSQPHDDRQGRGRSPPALVVLTATRWPCDQALRVMDGLFDGDQTTTAPGNALLDGRLKINLRGPAAVPVLLNPGYPEVA